MNSQIDIMIKQLCPNGVEKVKLGEVCSVLRGKRLTKNQLSETSGYPVYHGGQIPIGYYTEANREADTVMVINVGASAGTVGYCGEDFWSSDGCFCLRKSKKALSKFVYACLTIKEHSIKSQVRHAGIPTLDQNVIEKLVIPLPPLTIQQEIVKILDKFTSLIDKIDEEINLRQKQYEYYREKLLTFEEGTKLKVSKFAELKAGKAISASELSEVKDDEHPYPCYGGNGLRGYINKKSHNGDYAIIGRQGALCGCINWACGEFYATEHAVVVTPIGNNNTRFLNYLFTFADLNQYKSAGAQPGLAVSKLNELEYIIPSPEKQHTIVQTLDKFEALIGKLKEERALRQKQYEYYREKLLSF